MIQTVAALCLVVGCAVYAAWTLLPAAARALRPGGRLLCEIGFGQMEEVARLVEASGLQWRGARPDLAGIPRVVVADRPGAPL